jgi:serine/threonine protein kinase
LANPLALGDPEQIGEFWLTGRLGAGGQGVVYDAYGPDGTRVAIKVLHGAHESPNDLTRMAAEARAAQRVASFCTARIVHVRLEPPRPYIVDEYIDGLSLREAVIGTGEREPRRFGGDDLHRLGIGIATALTAIHQAKVVHRDLKPGNVMLGPDGPRLIDFGIARVLDTASATRGGLVGTLRYMPPQVCAGQQAGAEGDPHPRPRPGCAARPAACTGGGSTVQGPAGAPVGADDPGGADRRPPRGGRRSERPGGHRGRAGRALTPEEWKRYLPSGLGFREVCP